VTESTPDPRGRDRAARDGLRADIVSLVTTKLQTLTRRVAVLTFAAALPVLVASPAGAEVPDGWSDPAPVDRLHVLLVLVGIPLLLFVLIAVAVYVPALIRGENVAPGSHPIESQWFGGPRSGTHELEASSPSSADAHDTGGASGRW
jgi:hypothetical protein